MFHLFLAIIDMISVPPVEDPTFRIMPAPIPPMMPEKTATKNRSSCGAGVYGIVSGRATTIAAVPITLYRMNFQLSSFKPSRKMGMFNARIPA